MAINTLYLDGNVLRKAKEVYRSQEPRNIRLEQFFQPVVFALLQRKIMSSTFHLKFNPLKYKYETAYIEEVRSFLEGRYFHEIVLSILGLKKYKLVFELRRFQPGQYTLLHDAEKEPLGIDFVLDFSEHPRNTSGCIHYLTNEEELLQLDPQPNTLSFVERKLGVMKYVKYVNHQQKTVILVMGTLLPRK